jgi:Flp pilus assembly protein TadG
VWQWRAGRERRPERDRGSATVELAVLSPALLAVLGGVLVAGRLEAAAGAVEQAASAAARSASLARTPQAAQDDAHSAATATLDERALHCTGLDITVRSTQAATGPAGDITPGQARVTLTCTLDLAAITVPGMPGTRQITGSGASVIDVYRSAP